MKRLSGFSISLFTFFLSPVLSIFINSRKKTGYIYLLLMTVAFVGCFLNFYKVKTQRSLDKETISAFKNSDKYFIIHLKDGNYALKNISVNNNLLDADIGPISPDHSKYLNPDLSSSNTYRSKYITVLSEIHLYAPNQSLENKSHFSVPVTSFNRVDIYEFDKSRTLTNHIISGVGIGIVAAFFIFFLIVLVTCNCPQVYTYENGQYQFKSGVFSGAIYSSLERSDYLPLENLKDNNGKFLFRIMNNQQEEQFINRLQLVQVTHDSSTSILLDRQGLVHNYKNPTAPVSTSLNNDPTNQILKYRDGNSFIFNQKADSTSDFGSTILTFDKPENTKQAKLIVNAKNSIWAGYLFEDFSSMFGDKFQKYNDRQDKVKKQKLDRWQMEQALPLMVYVETNKGWQLVDYFPITGNTAARDMIMAINIPETKSKKIRLKLESAYMFWELDYAAMDFSADDNLKPEVIEVSTAVKSNGSKDETINLKSKDNQYSKLLQDEYVSVEFKKPAQKPAQKPEQVNSYFLVSTGYYHSLKNYEGKPDIARLKQFRKKGAFNQFSERRYIAAQAILAKGIELQDKSSN